MVNKYSTSVTVTEVRPDEVEVIYINNEKTESVTITEFYQLDDQISPIVTEAGDVSGILYAGVFYDPDEVWVSFESDSEYIETLSFEESLTDDLESITCEPFTAVTGVSILARVDG